MPDPDKLVDVAQTRSEIEASTIVEALRARGIAANSYGGALAGFRADLPSFVRVVVRAADLQRARLALASIKADSIDLNWDEIDVGQPEDPAPPGSADRPIMSGPRLAHRARVRRAMIRVAVGLLALFVLYFVRLSPLLVLFAGVTVLLLVVWAIFQMLRAVPEPPSAGLIAQHEPADGAFSALPLDDRRQ